jgi:MSHA biogenesis protein MshI
MFFRRQSHDGSQWVSVIQDGTVLHAAQVAHKAGALPRVLSISSHEANTLEAGLRNLRTSKEIRGCPLIGVLDRTQYRMHAGEAPDVARQEWPDAMRWQLKEQVDFPVEDAVLDVLEVNSGTQLRQNAPVMVFVVPRADYATIELAADDVGLSWTALDVPETALRNLCTLGEDEEKAHALVAFGENHGMLVITFKGELLMARHIEVAVSAVTGEEDVRGAALSRAALEILRTIDTFERMHSQVALSNLTVALPPGCGAETIDMLADLIYVPLNALELSSWIDLSALGEGAERLNRNATFSELCLIGSTLRADANSKIQQLQLLDPNSVLGQSPPWGAVLGVRVASGVLAVGLTAGLGFSAVSGAYNHRATAIETDVAALREKDMNNPPSPVLRELEALRQKDAQQRQMQDALQGGLVWASAGYSDFLMALGRQTHPGVWITGLVLHGDGRDLVLMGRTNNSGALPAYLQQLAQEERFKGRRFAQLDVMDMGQDVSLGKSASSVLQFTLRSLAMNAARRDQPTGASTQDAVNSVARTREANQGEASGK